MMLKPITCLNNNANHGFTLTELLVSITILGIIATIAVPSLNNTYSTQKVSGLAERVKTEIVWARTQAILKSRPVTMSFFPSSSWCYGFEYDTDNNPATSNCNCGSPSMCVIDGAQKSTSFIAFPNTSLATTLPSSSITFDSRGLATGVNSTITLSDGISSVRITMNPLGHGTLCSNEIVKYKSCI